MPDQPTNESIMNSPVALDGRPDLSLSEVTIGGLWSIQSSKTLTLDTFAMAVFNRDSKMGAMLSRGNLRLIQLSHGKALLLSEQIELPAAALDFAAITTDISHAFCQLALSGNDSLTFLNAYTTVDLEDETITTARCVRTRFGQYPLTLWWHRLSDIHILVDRSYARSLINYLQALSNRWF